MKFHLHQYVLIAGALTCFVGALTAINANSHAIACLWAAGLLIPAVALYLLDLN